jgi:hypothetical protein
MLAWPLHQRALNRMQALDQFSKYLSQVQPSKFLAYQNASSNKRSQFLAVLESISVVPRNLAFLDLGPGYGDALDVWHEQGGKSVSFTEIDPFFFTYNRLKGFTTSYQLNHLSKLRQLPVKSFDVIWCKGAIVADHAILSEKLPLTTWCFSKWITQVEQLAVPGGHLVLCPHWRNDGTRRRVQDAAGSLLSHRLLDRGYEILPTVPGHNHEPEYPLTYHKQLDRR